MHANEQLRTAELKNEIMQQRHLKVGLKADFLTSMDFETLSLM
jgi:hypothetical protein